MRFGKHTFERPFAEEEYHEIFAVPPQNPAAELQRCEDLRLVEAEEVMLFPSRLPAVGQAKQPGRLDAENHRGQFDQQIPDQPVRVGALHCRGSLVFFVRFD